MKKNSNLFLTIMLLTSFSFVSCGKDGDDSSSGSSNIPSYTSEEVETYMNNLKSSSQENHLYIHYYRFNKKASDFKDWDAWVWPYKPKEGEGYRFDWQGKTPSENNTSSSGTAILDSFYYATIDIDLTKDYDGGWNSTTKTMGGHSTNFYVDDAKTELIKEVGIQIVQTSSRTSGQGFWKNDGGNLYINLENYALTNNDKTTSYHVFLTQDYVQQPAARPANDGSFTDPFLDDDGTNSTYGNNKYNDVNWTNKPLQKTSPSFLNGQGNGNVLPYGAGVGYQIMVASFSDSDGDGFGDIYGIEQKLDYIQNLGVNVLWLTPIQMSDSYHGYDISDYLSVDPKFGSRTSPAALLNGGVVNSSTAKADYKSLIDAAHSRGMAVVMDLVINHTSTSNNWFISSATLNEDYRGYYQWGNHTTQSNDIKETKFWYPYGSHVYSYYAKFGSSMPELNYAYSDTRAAVSAVALNWLEFGVDGFRMDAVKHIFLDEEVTRSSSDTIVKDISTNANTGLEQDYSSNLTKNLNFWRDLNATCKSAYPNAFFVGENFDGHAYRVAPYYEGFDSLFDFYSYFNLTSVASSAFRNGNTGAYSGSLSSFLGAWDNSSNNEYSASSDDKLEGAKQMSYEGNWNLKSVMNVNNQYRTGGQKSNATNGYSMIGGQFTSNHDIARAINRIAGSTYSSNGVESQGEVTVNDYTTLDSLSTLYEITQLMLPGCTWIYYGDELGMTGNLQGKKATDGYADLTYRQPMKWKQDGVVGDGSNTCGYSISGSGANVKWDNINATTTVKDATTQVDDINSHYNKISKFAKIKSQTPALIKGAYDVASIGDGKYAAKITRTLGSETYKFFVNFSNSSLSTGDSSLNSIPAKSAVLVKGNQVVAQYNGTTGTSSGGTVNATTTYTVSSLPSWIESDGCIVYAWVWGGNYGIGAWVPATINGTTLTLTLDPSATHLLLARCIAGTTMPDWQNQDNTIGRIYNKTNDITLTSGVTTYTANNWPDYTPY